jgi:hypothetical protein
LLGYRIDHMMRVVVAVGPGEDENAKLHSLRITSVFLCFKSVRW